MKTAKEQIQETIRLWKLETDYAKACFEEDNLAKPLELRRTQGLVWYPLQIVEEDTAPDGNPVLVLERQTRKRHGHFFQSGQPVLLFQADQPAGHKHSGTITAIEPDRLKIVFAGELPDWAFDGRIGIEPDFSETTFTQGMNALQKVASAENNSLATLREILLGNASPNLISTKFSFANSALNPSQNDAIQAAMAGSEVFMIQGPPGTGKTTTLTELITTVLQQEPKVLVCAPSNAAVDLLAEKLAQQNIRVLRIGNPARLSERLFDLTLEGQLRKHPEYKQIKAFHKEAAEIRRQATKYKRNFDRAAADQRKQLLQESRNLVKEARLLADQLTKETVQSAQAILCTLVGAASELIESVQNIPVFMDEAAQAPEPLAWIPILKAKRVILAGDHCQLPPTILSAEASRAGLSKTLFEKAMLSPALAEVRKMLTIQYRMHQNIMDFPSLQFYSGQLQADESVKDRCLDHLPVCFVDTAGTGWEEQFNPESKSFANPEEGRFLISQLENWVTQFPDQSVAVISPYKEQVEWLRTEVQKNELFSGKAITVDSVDGFQGQERDSVWISLVRSNERHEIGFLADTRRMNVAMTRARKKLFILGDSSTLSENRFYKQFLDYVYQTGSYQSVWEYS